MDKIKKITKMKLFLPIFSMILVMMINVEIGRAHV